MQDLSGSDLKSFWNFSIYFIFVCDFWSIEIYGNWIWGVKAYGWVKKAVVSFVIGVRGGCLAWNPYLDIMQVVYTIYLWAIDFQHSFHIYMWLLIDWDIWYTGCQQKGHMDEWKKVRFRLYLELDVNFWLKLQSKIQCKSYIPFFC